MRLFNASQFTQAEAVSEMPPLPGNFGAMKHLPWRGYAVSDQGVVWCCLPCGHVKGFVHWRPLKGKIHSTGHVRLSLATHQKAFYRYVHRLVLEAFRGPAPEGCEACHNDGNPTNNSLANLRWGTRRSNSYDRRLHGTELLGERSSSAKLTEQDVIEIRRTYIPRSRDRNQKVLSQKYGVCKAQIARIVKRVQWTHLGGN